MIVEVARPHDEPVLDREDLNVRGTNCAGRALDAVVVFGNHYSRIDGLMYDQVLGHEPDWKLTGVLEVDAKSCTSLDPKPCRASER
jgi:hypothetical protein